MSMYYSIVPLDNLFILKDVLENEVKNTSFI